MHISLPKYDFFLIQLNGLRKSNRILLYYIYTLKILSSLNLIAWEETIFTLLVVHNR